MSAGVQIAAELSFFTIYYFLLSLLMLCIEFLRKSVLFTPVEREKKEGGRDKRLQLHSIGLSSDTGWPG